MSKYLSCIVVVLTGIACGGTTDTGDGSSGGTSAGGSNSAGHGGSSAAGKSSGGSVSTGGGGSGSGGTGAGGVIVTAGTATGGFGGAAPPDPRCPSHLPNGACDATDTGLKCEYDNFTGCLCYPSPPGSFGLCQKFDPTCTNAGGAAAAAPPSDGGMGGISAKVALPPHEICSCNAEAWNCTFGF